MLSEPTDGLTKSTLSLALTIFVYLYLLLTVLIKCHLKIIGRYVILSGDKNVFINHGQRRRKRPKPLPQMYIKVCTTDADPPDEPFSWDTDGISFIIDNSATAIISNMRKLFTGSLTGVLLRSYIYDHFFTDCTVPMVEWYRWSAYSGWTLVA